MKDLYFMRQGCQTPGHNDVYSAEKKAFPDFLDSGHRSLSSTEQCSKMFRHAAPKSEAKNDFALHIFFDSLFVVPMYIPL